MTLEQFLEWDSEASDSEYATEFDRRAEVRLSTALRIVKDQAPALGNQLIALAAVLPPERVLHVAHTPELEFQLRDLRTGSGTSEALSLFLGRAFEAELDEESDGYQHSGEELEIDFDGLLNRGDVERRFPVFGALEADDRFNLPGRLNSALRLLDQSAPAAGRFTRKFTKIVVPLAVPDLDSRFGSFSSSWYPGRTVLVNPNFASLFDLTAAILHEAIHSLVDVSEIGGCLIAEGESGDCKVESPWTGARISLQSLMDAYFVWYGLLRFWMLAKENGAVSSRVADPLIALCGRGFFREFEVVVGDQIRAVHEKTREAIESLRRAVFSLGSMSASLKVAWGHSSL